MKRILGGVLVQLLLNKRVLAVLLTLLLAAAGVTGVQVVVDDGPAPAPAPTVTPVATPDQAAVDQAVKPGSDLASDLRSESGISAADQAANRELAKRVAPLASGRAANAPPCTVDYSGHVYSDRAAGVRPTEFVLHYTVSANKPGWADVRAIQNYFKTSRVGSAHFIVDFEGHCLKMVPGSKKAWTQGNANSYAYSVEIIATGSESAAAWRASPLIKNGILANLVASVMHAHDLPIVRVDPVGCVFPPGWTDHNHLECGNDHHDVSPHFPFKVFSRQLRALR